MFVNLIFDDFDVLIVLVFFIKYIILNEEFLKVYFLGISLWSFLGFFGSSLKVR